MTIQTATVADLPRMQTAALRFFASSEHLGTFNLAYFTQTWTRLLESGLGVIFTVEDTPQDGCARGAIVGALGGVAYPDPHTGALAATEFFWFVEPEHRGSAGLKLYIRFEQWAYRKNCATIRMVHLLDSMPEKLAHTYQRLGFKAAEIHYSKELKQ